MLRASFRAALYSAMMHAVKGAEGNETGGWHLPVCLAVYTTFLAIGTWRAWIYIKKYIHDTMYSRLRDTEVDVYTTQEIASGSDMFSGQAFQLGTVGELRNRHHPDGKDFYVDPEMEFYVRCNSGHTRQVEIQSIGRPLYSEQQKEPQHDEPDYDLPTDSIPPSPHPSRSEAPHEDEGAAQPKHRMRRPAPPSLEEERKIKPFAKKPITFMFHATYGSQLYNIMEHGLKSGKVQSNPAGRMHVHMARIDDVILDDDESEAALTYVPAGRDALLILAFLSDNEYGIRLSEERTALTDKTIKARNIVAAFETDGTLMASNKWIMKKHLDHEDYEMYDTKIREFADAFFKHVNSTKEKDTSSETKKRRHSTDQDEVEEETMEPSGERSVKPKIIVEYHHPENPDEFIQELKGTYLDTDMNKRTQRKSSRRPRQPSPDS